MASEETDSTDEDLARREKRVAFLERVAATHDSLRNTIVEIALYQTCPGAYRVDVPIDHDERAVGPIADFARRASKILKFLNHVCGPKAGWDLHADAMHALATAVQAGFLRDKSPYRAGRERIYEWESDPAAVAAASITVDEAANHGNQHGPACDLAPKAVEWYANIVAYRRRLLDIDKLAYFAGVEAVAHPTLPSQAHAAVIELARVIRTLESFTGAFGDWANVAPSLIKAIQDASVFSHSADATERISTPAPGVSTPLNGDDAQSAESKPQPPVREKRSTEKGEAEAKLIAALAAHHKYSDGSCLNLEPVKNNALARLADVDQGSASYFFKKHFRGHRQYTADCQKSGRLSGILAALVGDVAGWKLFGRVPASEGSRAEAE
ncbi:MAG: hypothetical protein ACK6CT_07805 [Planctomycetia bacterium]|jgi:hypothetical protein